MHAHRPAQFRYLTVRLSPYVEKSIESRFHSLAHFVFGGRSERKTDHFEFRPIVPFKEIRHQVTRGVFAKIGREVSDLQPLRLRGPAIEFRAGAGGELVLDEDLGALPLRGR